MIEVERKFNLNEEEKQRLLKGAARIGVKTFTDVYYDTQDFKLISRDWWLRARAGKFELKISLNRDIARLADQYNELESDQEIRHALGLLQKKSLAQDLHANGYKQFLICTTTRAEYKKGEFTIDVDEVCYDDSQEIEYRVAEIELMIEDKKDMEQAAGRIIAFAKDQQINVKEIGGKVHYYIKTRMPEQFKRLVSLRVLRNV